MEDFIDKFGIIGVAAVIVGIVVTILFIIAVLKIPKIAKYQKSTLKLTALMAKKQGVATDEIKAILSTTDETIMTEYDNQFDKFLDYGE